MPPGRQLIAADIEPPDKQQRVVNRAVVSIHFQSVTRQDHIGS